jgi:hypothetical protein
MNRIEYTCEKYSYNFLLGTHQSFVSNTYLLNRVRILKSHSLNSACPYLKQGMQIVRRQKGVLNKNLPVSHGLQQI